LRRPIPAAADATWTDLLAMDSAFDYDPVWAKCVELKVAVTSHSTGTGWPGHASPNHYIHNHVGTLAAGGEAFAKALVLGGVTKRFPAVNFAFLEGGVAWASLLYAGLVNDCGKRNPTAIGNYDPQAVDLELLADLFAEYGQDTVTGRPDPRDPNSMRVPLQGFADPLIAHELDSLDIRKAEDLRELFESNFYYGCEADDPFASLAFDGRLNPFGARLKAMLSSDIGHWDVPDMNLVLAEAYELVERELLDAAAFRQFTFEHAVGLHAGMNPDFFKGTVVEAAAGAALAPRTSRPGSAPVAEPSR